MQKKPRPTVRCSLLLHLSLFAIFLLMFYAEMGVKAALIPSRHNRQPQSQFTNFQPNILPTPTPLPITINHTKNGNVSYSAGNDNRNESTETKKPKREVTVEHMDVDKNVCNLCKI